MPVLHVEIAGQRVGEREIGKILDSCQAAVDAHHVDDEAGDAVERDIFLSFLSFSAPSAFSSLFLWWR